MSFALEVKSEVLAHEFDENLSKCFLAGFIKYNGDLIFSNNKEKLRLTSNSNKIARSIFKLCKQNFSGLINIGITQAKNSNKVTTYYIILEGQISVFLQSLNVVDKNQIKIVEFIFDFKKLSKDLVKNFKRAYIAGVFVAIGSVNSPNTTNYHLELQFKDLVSAKYWVVLLKDFNFEFKVLKRSDKLYISYIKKSLLVSDFLKLIDAYQCVMKFENARISREFHNNINRTNNVDVYNNKKALVVGLKQVDEISKIQSKIASSQLSIKAQALMELRIENPDASYSELTNKMIEKGFIITKSGISNLFKIIHKLSEEL
ncbi:DNA-binding protein WhiA [Entomoplasma ellychniae]|uniref:Probable cell division protein WhiA n=1 Tax=Entomoplasma ellychniae TaxID=2114 RepID=A0A8E2QWA0_9MOLU|nr:DNA-binding protein WhiA [Entomoplasma ellychniae]PPE04852.1 DNA-binding protein WhiA [Entomoplasma ellychniae]